MALNPYTLIAIVALASSTATAAWIDEERLEVKQQGSISYVSGGIGEGETENLRSMQHQYSLHISNADKLGHFSGDTRIVISDTQGSILLETDSGPLLYVNLPAGSYMVEGFSEGQSKKQAVTIVNGKGAYVRFIWAQDESDALNY